VALLAVLDPKAEPELRLEGALLLCDALADIHYLRSAIVELKT